MICIADTAYAKNKETNKWYNFDDSRISEITEDRLVVSTHTYTLLITMRVVIKEWLGVSMYTEDFLSLLKLL